MDDTFLFEYFLKLDKSQYLKIWQTPLSTDKIKNKFLKKLILSLLLIPVILLLFFKYTIVLGIVITIFIFIFAILIRFSPKFLKVGHRYNYDSNKILSYKLKYTINEKGMKVNGKYIDTFCAWHLLYTWQIRGDWLILTTLGTPQLYLPISILKENGIYNIVMKKVKNYGIQFNQVGRKT